jgi:hypothetical protein
MLISQKKNLVVVVCGARDWELGIAPILRELRARQDRLIMVMDGGARGVDTMGNVAGKGMGISTAREFAEWDKYHRAAGPIRNKKMVKFLVMQRERGMEVEVLAFHQDITKSKGTANMKKQSEKAGIPVSLFSC